MKFDPRFFEKLLFYAPSPDIVADIIFKDINKNILCHIKDVVFSSISNTFVDIPNMHFYDELLVEVIHENNKIFEDVFFRNIQKSYINKKDLTFLIDTDYKIYWLINHYLKYGDVTFDINIDAIKSKYIIVLKEYLINVPEFINNVFFNYNGISGLENRNIYGGLRESIILQKPLTTTNIKILNKENWRL